jgi:hypothetical protein
MKIFKRGAWQKAVKREGEFVLTARGGGWQRVTACVVRLFAREKKSGNRVVKSPCGQATNQKLISENSKRIAEVRPSPAQRK